MAADRSLRSKYAMPPAIADDRRASL